MVFKRQTPDPRRRVKLIILDTNILFGNWEMEGEEFALLIGMVSAGIAEVGVPEVVVKELAAQEVASIKDSADSLKSWLISAHPFWLGRLRSLEDDTTPGLGKSRRRKWVAEELQKSQDFSTTAVKIQDFLSSKGFKILSHRIFDHARLADDYFLRRKPLKIDGSGVADWIIWDTVVNATPEGSDVVFVSKNTNDFAAPLDSSAEKSRRTLHSDLLDDVGNFNSFSYATSLEQLLADYLSDEVDRYIAISEVEMNPLLSVDQGDEAIAEVERYLMALEGKELDSGGQLADILASNFKGGWKVRVDAVEVYSGDATWEPVELIEDTECAAAIRGKVEVPVQVEALLEVNPEDVSDFILINPSVMSMDWNKGRPVFRVGIDRNFEFEIEGDSRRLSVLDYRIA